MLHELDGEAAKRTAMIADAQSLDDAAGFEPQSWGASEDVGLEVVCHQ
jgi:hypothetical protein